jgi:uncharacterized protein YigE (DUF2233 family)
VLLSGGAEAAHRSDPPCEARTFEGARFTVCAFDFRHQEMRLVWKDRDGRAMRTFGKLANHLGQYAMRLRFAVNAGMYEDDGSDTPVSFGRLARFFRDGLKCRDALYFDGVVSSLWVPAQARRTGGDGIGPMIAVPDKP